MAASSPSVIIFAVPRKMPILTKFRRLLRQVRMGTSALVSALNALPWDEDEDADSSDSDDEPKGGRGRAQQQPSRPKRKPLQMECTRTC